ncbi:PTS beta-glucoside transporter subunit IIABC [Erwinia sp. CPCC 100877]|nr:PTS beta-glucoside transporter subunit IIABC [Erwinia sp. CPCC 100877]
MKYEKLSTEILKNIGGKENIQSITHCITRLRFKLKDEAKADTEAIKALDGVVTVVKSAGQYQIVIGNHVPEVYKEFIQLAGISEENTNSAEKPKGFLNTFVDIVSGIFTPVIGVLMAAGMIKGVLALLTAFHVIDKESGTYLIINASGDAFFYFFPLFLGYTASKKFGSKPFLGMAIGAALVYPAIVAANSTMEPLYTIFAGTPIESPVYITFLGIPVILMNYGSSVIPIIAATFLAAKIEAGLTKIIPAMVRSFFVTFLTLMITIPLTFIIVGPITTWIGLLLGDVLAQLYAINPIIAGVVIGGFWQVFIMFGLHWGFVPIALNNYATLGYDVVMMAGLATPVAMAGVTLGIFLKTKNKKVKEIAFPAFLSALFGITEPALYGITLPRKKAFYATSAAVAVAGGIMGIFNTKVYINGGTGIFALPRFIHPEAGIDNSFIGFAIASGVAFLIGLGLALTIAYDPKQDTEEKKETREKSEFLLNQEMGKNTLYELQSPITGEVVALEQIQDEAFSSGLLGKGVAIIPQKGEVIAPADGVVTTLFPTKHAIGLITENGVEVLIHVGMDTVNLQGQYFDAKVNQGDTVKKGQVLLTFDIENITKAGYSVITPVIITNTADYLDVINSKEDLISESDPLLTVIS